MSQLFDDITRVVGSPMPRRQAFRLIARGLAGGCLALLWPGRALAVVPTIRCDTIPDFDPNDIPVGVSICSAGVPMLGQCCTDFNTCCGGGCCETTECCRTNEKGEDVCVPCPEGMCCVNDMCITCPPRKCCISHMCVDCPNQQANFWIEGYYADHIDMLVQNMSGLASISVAEAVNCTVSIPSFPMGTTDPVEVTATKINLALRSRVVLQACPPDIPCDRCCNQGDPVLAQLEIPAQEFSVGSKSVKEVFKGIPEQESYISIQNGTPGLKKLRIRVNGETFETLKLKGGEQMTIDVASEMEEGANKITLIGYGDPGTKALILISDVAGSAGSQSTNQGLLLQRYVRWQELQHQPGQNLTWGR